MLRPYMKRNNTEIDETDQYCIRKTTQFGQSGVLKERNRLQYKATLAQISNQYQKMQQKTKNFQDKKPLKNFKQQNHEQAIFFAKKPRHTTCLYSSYKQNTSYKHERAPRYTVSAYYNQQNVEQQKKRQIGINDKLAQKFQQRSMIQRCYSSCTLNLNVKKSPLIKSGYKSSLNKHVVPNQKQYELGIQKQRSIIVSEQQVIQSLQVLKNFNTKSPSFLNKKIGRVNDATHKKPQFNHQIHKINDQNRLHCRSNYMPQFSTVLNRQKSLKKYKKLINYGDQPKKQSKQYRLCINCEIYVNKQLVSEHQQKCLGFKIILKMSNTELIDFLDEKIDIKLTQLKLIQEKCNQAQIVQEKNNCQDKLSLQTINVQIPSRSESTLQQTKNKINQILTDLNSTRLKALKKFHPNTQQKYSK